jgi:hypothetical protein
MLLKSLEPRTLSARLPGISAVALMLVLGACADPMAPFSQSLLAPQQPLGGQKKAGDNASLAAAHKANPADAAAAVAYAKELRNGGAKADALAVLETAAKAKPTDRRLALERGLVSASSRTPRHSSPRRWRSRPTTPASSTTWRCPTRWTARPAKPRSYCARPPVPRPTRTPERCSRTWPSSWDWAASMPRRARLQRRRCRSTRPPPTSPTCKSSPTPARPHRQVRQPTPKAGRLPARTCYRRHISSVLRLTAGSSIGIDGARDARSFTAAPTATSGPASLVVPLTAR